MRGDLIETFNIMEFLMMGEILSRFSLKYEFTIKNFFAYTVIYFRNKMPIQQ